MPSFRNLALPGKFPNVLVLWQASYVRRGNGYLVPWQHLSCENKFQLYSIEEIVMLAECDDEQLPGG